MNSKAKIKIIKRSEQQPKSAVKAAKKKTPTTKSNARDMVATVTSWVNEFQQKRREETKEAINNLFSQTPNPAGCTNC